MKTQLVTTQVISQAALQAVVSASLIVTLLFAGFIAAEPRISHGQSDTKTFRIRQTITDETSFLVAPANTTMVGTVYGITGGSATGTSRFVVKSNNSTGYYVEISYLHGGTQAMVGDKDGGAQLRDYTGDVAGEPSFNFTASTAAQFAYTVNSSTTSDTDPSFKNNSTVCNSGATQTFGKCWKKPTLAAFRIISRTTPATTGATSTIYFKVHVPSGAVPIPTGQTYTATATLSLFIQ